MTPLSHSEQRIKTSKEPRVTAFFRPLWALARPPNPRLKEAAAYRLSLLADCVKESPALLLLPSLLLPSSTLLISTVSNHKSVSRLMISFPFPFLGANARSEGPLHFSSLAVLDTRLFASCKID